ncbi:MAG TPA: response regulator [Anaeromyxobacteraceae bacterium]|nr:response regulator [Anaeromyxobacteraceae bacterium]
MTDERRAHPRFPLILAVQYVGAESVRDYTENLSASGLFIRTERDFTVGERVTLVVSFPQLLEPVELQVEILRKRRAGLESPAGVAVRVPPDCTDDRAKLADIALKVGSPRAGVASLRVLLVEDNALVASMYAAALRRLAESDGLPEFAVEVAGNGAAAYDRLLAAPRVDVLVTDLFMPVLSGISLVEKVRAEPSIAHLPIVVITSGGDRERDQLSGLGIDLFLRKPVSYQDVAGVMRTLIGSRKAAAATAAPGGGEEKAGLTSGSDVGMDGSDAIPASRR